MRPTICVAFSIFLAMGAKADDFDRPIPQGVERQKRSYNEMLAWHRKTMGGAYEKIGKRNPKWDTAAREALDIAARRFSLTSDPDVPMRAIYGPAKRAVDAGCDDPMVLYMYATASTLKNYPGPAEFERRFKVATTALEKSDYAPAWRALALRHAALAVPTQNPSPEDLKEEARLFDAAVALAIKSFAVDEPSPQRDVHLFMVLDSAVLGNQRMSGDWQALFDRVDTALAAVPALKVVRLQVRAKYLTAYGWDARGRGFAGTVTDEGAETFRKRLTEARKTLEEAWKLQPGSSRTANNMLTVERGIGGNRAEMEKWFSRAMEADVDNVEACNSKRLSGNNSLCFSVFERRARFCNIGT